MYKTKIVIIIKEKICNKTLLVLLLGSRSLIKNFFKSTLILLFFCSFLAIRRDILRADIQQISIPCVKKLFNCKMGKK
jgi:hypothetical protein